MVLYKKDTTGKTRFLEIYADGEELVQISGVVGTENPIEHRKKCIGKNIGKKNETSNAQQAVAEAEALVDVKLKNNYFEDINSVDQKEFRPMKGLIWKDQKKKTFPLMASYKLDGSRSTAEWSGAEVVLKSFTGEIWVACPHISDALKPLLEKHPNLKIDGEFYNMSYAGRFNELMSLVRKQTPTEEELLASKAVIEFHVYDLYDENNPEITGFNRVKSLSEVYKLHEISPYIKLVPQKMVHNETEFNMFHEEALSLNCEGTCGRTDIAYTVGKKGKGFYKRKDYQDAEFELVDFLSGEGAWEGKGKKAIIKLPNGNLCGVGVTGTYDECEEYLVNKDKYIGKLATVTFLAYTPDGVLREGILKDVDRPDINLTIKQQ